MKRPPENLNIMLLGMTGSGKSSSGNTIIGVRDTFKEDFSPSSVTGNCQLEQAEVDGRTITVIDTVGLSDTSVKVKDAQTEIEKILQDINLDVFLLVIRLGVKFTENECNVVQWIKENFGAKVLKHTIVLFTHADQLHVPVEEYVSKSETLRSIVDQCSGGFHVFKNKDKDRSQVTELLKKTESLQRMNGNRRYTEQDYKEAQDEILQRKYTTGAALGGGAGGLGGAAGGAIAAKVGVTVLTAGKAAVIGAAGGTALLAVAVGAGAYFLARKYNSREKDKTE